MPRLPNWGAANKPVITIFNKMDKYEADAFDEWLEESVKRDSSRPKNSGGN